MNCPLNPEKIPGHIRVHILVFILAFLAALTIAHPAFLVNDEWITGNQLSQLKQGHQPFITEGKYGTLTNGTSSTYFTVRNNYLGYPLLYPLLAVPSVWLVDLFGNDFIFFITYLWTFLLIGFALILNAFFPEYTRLGKWRWTSGFIVLTFVGFFANLFFYQPFSLTGDNGSPEIMAIVFTNVLMFAFLAVIIFEILRMIFNNLSYAVFGTVVCLSSSSYLFWTTYCKDHVLVALIFSIVLLFIIKHLTSDKPSMLAGGFFFGGLLIWARPELGIFIFIALCLLLVLYFQRIKNNNCFSRYRKWVLLSPFFTLLGAIPFFINNYLVSKNIFIPAFVLTAETSVSQSGLRESSTTLSFAVEDTVNALLQVNSMTSVTPLSTLPADLYGVFFSPESGSMGILPLVPVFLASVMILPILLMKNRVQFDSREKQILGTLALFSFAIFCAYANRIAGLNADLGIVPDIRYLSPIYLPLTIIGLIFFRKIPRITAKPINLLVEASVVWIITVPISVFLIMVYYPKPSGWKDLYPLFSHWATLCILLCVLAFVIIFYCAEFRNRQETMAKIVTFLFVGICALPLIWQVDVSFISLLHGYGLGGYFFWVPVLLKLFNVVAI